MTKEEVINKKFCLICLGCDKNRVDAENMRYMLQQYGFESTDNIQDANFAIINTCAFINDAKQESIETILQVAQLKKRSLEKLVVTGCLAQRYYEQIKQGMPEVDVVVRLVNNKNIVQVIKGLYGVIEPKNEKTKFKQPCRILSTPSHYAYLKIADGCNNYCSYCTIPQIRGRYKSKEPKQLVLEAKALVKSGVRELILVAQDVTSYGIDLYGKPVLVELIKMLSKIKKLKWIRLHYCYPNQITNELLNEIATNPKVCKYLDIPMQHASDNILKQMNRKDTLQQYNQLLQKIHNLPEYVAVRSTFIVGFPGETKQDFDVLKQFLSNQKLQCVGFFSYSREEYTAAYDMPHQVSEKTKQSRLKQAQQLQQQILLQNQQNMVGKTMPAVLDMIDENGEYIFRSQYNSPNVDTVIYVKTDKKLKVGEFYNIKIIDMYGIDHRGEIV